MNYTTKVGVPSAYITRKKSRLKIYNGHNVFLNDGDNFEFELHNPKQKSILAKIKLNGEYISTSGIVIRPGQRVFLERFLDSNNKFEFSTYKVKDNDENRMAIALNGFVEIEFYDEQPPVNQSNYYPHLSGGIWKDGWSRINTGSPYYGDITFTNSNNTYGTTTTYSTNSLRSFSLETGRVEKGESSSQNFTNSYEKFSYVVSKRYEFKILPSIQKYQEAHDIRKYCTECGNKVKNNFKFCPSCGNKL